MARSIWKGAISFGLVNVPVKLYSAVSKKTVRFNQLHDADHARIQQKRVCSEDGEEVPYENIVKGFEIAPDRYVVITPDELTRSIPPRPGRST
jgi:DNA end-binding protein Ku